MLHQVLVAGFGLAGMIVQLSSPEKIDSADVKGSSARILAPDDLPKASSTGAWLSGAVRFLQEGDRLDGSTLRMLFDPEELTEGATEMGQLMDAIEYLEVEKPDRDKVRLVAFLKNEENIKRKFDSEGKEVKMALRHSKSRMLIERLSASKVMLRIRGIGAGYAGKPVPESLMRITIKGDELELMEVAGWDIDPGYDVELPKELQKE